MRILLTNDDGIHAEGLEALETIARALSDDVWICAPEYEQSGASRALTLSDPIRVRQLDERRFATTGTYQVWIRGQAPNGNDNSIHIGLDGAANTTADRLQVTTYGSWVWSRNTMDGVNATITVTTPGVHTIDMWMREDGLVVDRILLNRSTTVVPSGTGPAASPRS